MQHMLLVLLHWERKTQKRENCWWQVKRKPERGSRECIRQIGINHSVYKYNDWLIDTPLVITMWHHFLSMCGVCPPAGLVHSAGELPQVNRHRLRPHYGQCIHVQSVCHEQSGHEWEECCHQGGGHHPEDRWGDPPDIYCTVLSFSWGQTVYMSKSFGGRAAVQVGTLHFNEHMSASVVCVFVCVFKERTWGVEVALALL